MIVLKDNGDGTFLGADEEGNLFDGTTKKVCYDEFTVTTTVTEDGFDRVTSYGEHTISKGSLNKASFIDGLRSQVQTQIDLGNITTPISAEDEARWEADWDAEVALETHDKAYYDMPPGMDAVEKQFSYTDWVAR